MNFFNKKLKEAVAMTVLAMAFTFSPCSAATQETAADLVVYGKVYTSNANDRYAEAFAVKDGRYVYVGNKKGASAFVKDGLTKVIDHANKLKQFCYKKSKS